MKLGMAEILQKANDMPDDESRIAYLQANKNIAFINLLQLCFSRVKWALPDTDPPYKPCVYLDQEGMLYNEMKRMYLFLEGGNPNLAQAKRESLFISLLESIPPEDAKLILAVKRHFLPYPNITPEIINAAYPGAIDLSLLPEKVEIKEVNPETGRLPPGPKKGKKFSEEHKAKLREAAKAREAKKKLEKTS